MRILLPLRASWLFVAIDVVSVVSCARLPLEQHQFEHLAVVTSNDDEIANHGGQPRLVHATYIPYVLRNAHAQYIIGIDI